MNCPRVAKKFFAVSAIVAISFTATASSVFAQTRTQTRTGTSEGKIRACSLVADSLTRRSQNMVRHANLMMEKFDQVVSRVREFYNSRLYPQGKVVSNFDSLMNEIEKDKRAAQLAIDGAAAAWDDFNCDNNPRQTVQTFKTKVQSAMTALKEYKTSVRNLIVAVHSQAGTLK